MADQGKITVNYGLADEDGFPKNNTADVNFVDNQIDGPTGTWACGR